MDNSIILKEVNAIVTFIYSFYGSRTLDYFYSIWSTMQVKTSKFGILNTFINTISIFNCLHWCT